MRRHIHTVPVPTKSDLFRNFSGTVRVADEIEDKEIIELLKEAYETKLENGSRAYPNIKEIPRLVICEGDKVIAAAEPTPYNNTIYISSSLIESLNSPVHLEKSEQTNRTLKKPATFSEKIKTVFRHELYHIDNKMQNISKIASQRIQKRQRREEYRADEYGALFGKETDAASEAWVQITTAQSNFEKNIKALAQRKLI